ncbi:sensor histidine kinase, partial [Chloroflexi bacterium TSY]|nr:sensor histidine kinase [Chloroflexi bacterium TSY]
DSREQERLHMAQELHDGPLQDLIGIRFHLGVLADTIRHEPAREKLSLVQKSLQNSIRTIRAMCGEMRPPTLAPFGLEQAIRAHAQQFRTKFPDITVDLDMDADGQTLSEHIRLALFRIYQQAMVNVAQHANASHIRISFRLTDEQIRLKIVDDGCGFEVPHRWIELARDGHFGLLGVAERTEAIGGHLSVLSNTTVGTSLTVVATRLSKSG